MLKMPSFQALALGACLAAAVAEEQPTKFVDIVDIVNSQNAGWSAEVPTRFGSLEEVKRVCGAVLRGNESFREMDTLKTHDEFWAGSIPTDFDVRTHWPKCTSVSGHIRDQSDCGSCWAFASTEAFNDRRCIATGDTTLLSVEDTLSNCGFWKCGSAGCGGGQPGMAWRWFTSVGVVTGGDYDDIGKGDTCAPYSFAPCAHRTTPSAKLPACGAKEYPTPKIGSQCTERSYSKSYSSDKKRASSAYNLGSVKAIQKDIMKYGSASAAFTVYADFPTYKHGVYAHTAGARLGGHAVKIMGWGTESGQDYWLVANSWNDQWGDRGTFKIVRGKNDCGIESQVSAGTVRASNEALVI